ncbi:MAG: hypothetical protein Q8N16_00870 [bacterium]|nr:hypothetical protein [bacterium]
MLIIKAKEVDANERRTLGDQKLLYTAEEGWLVLFTGPIADKDEGPAKVAARKQVAANFNVKFDDIEAVIIPWNAAVILVRGAKRR